MPFQSEKFLAALGRVPNGGDSLLKGDDDARAIGTEGGVCRMTGVLEPLDGEEVVLNFGVNQNWDRMQQEFEIELAHRIILSPFAAKRLSADVVSIKASGSSVDKGESLRDTVSTLSAYDPAAVERDLYEDWVRAGLFHAAPDDDGEPFSIVIPPPNVTGSLHVGHALDNTIQDVIIRRDAEYVVAGTNIVKSVARAIAPGWPSSSADILQPCVLRRSWPSQDRCEAVRAFVEEAPENTVLPAISGIAQVGQTLTALEGSWTGAPSFTYQWEEDDGGWAEISGATNRTYVPVVGNVGNALRVVVTGTNSEGSESATSAQTAEVLAE